MANDKVYCGSGRKVGDWKRGISICLEDIPREWLKKGKNGKTYINLDVVDLREPNKWGKDVSVEVNTWTPDRQAPTSNQRPNTPENFESDQIPF